MSRASRWTAKGAALLVASGLLVWACGSLPEESPTQPLPENPAASAPTPDATPNPNPTPTPVLGGPAPKPTPTPTPEGGSPQPTPTPTPAGPEGASACGSPTPPPLSRINVNIHLRGGDWWVLDSTPLVGPDAAYCLSIGFTDGRSFCPVRPEGNPEREACELYVTGRAADTGRPGPTWYLGTSFCTGRAMGCDNHPENQYQAIVYGSGVYRACGRNGVCGEVQVDR